LDPQLLTFIKAKYAQAKALAEASHGSFPSEAESFFQAALRGDWAKAEESYERLSDKMAGKASAEKNAELHDL